MLLLSLLVSPTRRRRKNFDFSRGPVGPDPFFSFSSDGRGVVASGGGSHGRRSRIGCWPSPACASLFVLTSCTGRPAAEEEGKMLLYWSGRSTASMHQQYNPLGAHATDPHPLITISFSLVTSQPLHAARFSLLLLLLPYTFNQIHHFAVFDELVRHLTKSHMRFFLLPKLIGFSSF